MTAIEIQDFDAVIANYQLRFHSIKHQINTEKDPVLIFLHEGLGCIELWRDFPLMLAKATGCNAIVYDRRGYGHSDPLREARDIDYLHQEAFKFLPEIINYFSIKKPILIGHSDGGSIALLYAAKYPSNVLGVITEAAHVFVEDITLRGIKEAVTTYETTNLKDKLQLFHGEKSEQIFYAWANVWLQSKFIFWNIEHLLANIICPLLVMQGNDDEYGSPAQVEAIVSQVSGKAEALLLPDCGHTPHKQASDKTLVTMKKFIQHFTSS